MRLLTLALLRMRGNSSLHLGALVWRIPTVDTARSIRQKIRAAVYFEGVFTLTSRRSWIWLHGTQHARPYQSDLGLVQVPLLEGRDGTHSRRPAVQWKDYLCECHSGTWVIDFLYIFRASRSRMCPNTAHRRYRWDAGFARRLDVLQHLG